MNQLRERVASVLADCFDLDTPPPDNIYLADIEGCDSIKQLELTFMLEEEFSVRFSREQLGQMACLDDIVRVLSQFENNSQEAASKGSVS